MLTFCELFGVLFLAAQFLNPPYNTPLHLPDVVYVPLQGANLFSLQPDGPEQPGHRVFTHYIEEYEC